MPQSKHRKKTLAKNLAKNEINRAKRSNMRTAVKKAKEAIATDPAGADGVLVEATQRLDKAAKQRLIHPNKAARVKSRLAKAQNAAKAAAR